MDITAKLVAPLGACALDLGSYYLVRPLANPWVRGVLASVSSTGRILLGLGLVTHEEVDRLGQTALTLGKGSFKYAWCSDRTLEERERDLTINWSVRECTLASGREIEIVDVPGGDFTKNSFIGASLADVAMLVVAAGMGDFEAGYHDGTREHMQFAKSLGTSKVIVVVNKMDDYSIRNKGDRFAVTSQH